MSVKINIETTLGMAMAITSAVTEKECTSLWSHVDILDRPTVLEIGSYLGRSGIMLGVATENKNGFFYMVDPFYETDIEECRKNINNAGVRNYKILHERSELAGDQIPDDLDFIFDDGDHQESGVKQDCDIYIPKLKSGCVIAFHDYNSSWVDVKRVVDSRDDIYVENIVDSIAFCRKR